MIKLDKEAIKQIRYVECYSPNISDRAEKCYAIMVNHLLDYIDADPAKMAKWIIELHGEKFACDLIDEINLDL